MEISKGETLYIIDKIKYINKIKDKIKKDDIVITFDFFAKESLRNNGINVTPVSKYVTHDINKKGMWWLKEWAEKKTIDGKSFKEFCVYNGVSYWWFCDFFLWYHVLHKKTFYSLFYYTDILLNCIEKEKIKKIFCYSDNLLLNEILKEIRDKKKISMALTKNNMSVKIKENIPYIIESGKRLKFKLRKKFSRAHIKSLENVDFLIVTYTSQFKNGKDTYIGELIDEFNKKQLVYKIIDLDYTEDIVNIANGIKERLNYNYIPFEYFLESNKEKYKDKEIRDINKENSKDVKKIFEQKWNYIKNNNSFISSLNYRGLSFWNIMKDQFVFVFKHRFEEATWFIAAAENMIDTLKPKIIFLHDETSTYGRTIISSAKNKGIKTFALQHGLISDESFEYVNKREENDLLKCPIPDYTFAMGKFAKDLLTKKSSYNAENVIVTGQPRYDPFNVIINNSKHNRKQLISTQFLGVKGGNEKIRDKKKIVFIGQPLIEEECGDYVQTVFEAYSELQKTRKDVELIIKLHPRENGFKFYKELSQKYKIKPIIVKDIPILKVLKDSDIVITMHSAVGIEAVILKKPLIIVNTTGMDDIYPYTSSKEIPKCRNKDELLSTLKNMEKLKPSLSFLEYHLFMPKCGSSKRITETIVKGLNKAN